MPRYGFLVFFLAFRLVSTAQKQDYEGQNKRNSQDKSFCIHPIASASFFLFLGKLSQISSDYSVKNHIKI